jgi:DNA-binding transcriptional MerR regulator
MARRQAYNQVAQQRFEQQLGAGEFGRQQNLQQFEAQMAQREQQFKEAAAQRGMSNEEAEREWQMQRTQLDNMFQQQMQQAGYQNQLRQAQIAEEMQRRGFSLNEINALISGQQVGMPQMPQFSGAQAAQPAPYFQAADMGHQAALGNWSAQQAQRQAGANFFGDLLGTGVSAYSAGMFSDRELKRNIRRVGSTPAGQPTYTWDYVWGEPAFGVMADESPPEAVFRHPSGYLMVDYTRIR